VPATKAWSDQRSLSSGTDSLDLTALVHTNLNNVDFTGLKVQLLKLKAAAANTAAIVFADASSNGYSLFGDASGQITLPAKAQALFYFGDTLADVSSTVKALTITSTDLDATYDILIVAG